MCHHVSSRKKSIFAALEEISKWKNLEELDIGWSGMAHIGAAEFQDFARNCTRLKKVLAVQITAKDVLLIPNCK